MMYCIKEDYVSAWDIINTIVINNKLWLLLLIPPGQKTTNVMPSIMYLFALVQPI